MKKVFADTVYWIALINKKDQWRESAILASKALVDTAIVTTDEILTETLNFFSESGVRLRSQAVKDVRAILLNQNVEVVSCNHDYVLDAIEFYESRPDKGYSLTDCISMLVMRNRKLIDVLTRDQHFSQEGFNILL